MEVKAVTPFTKLVGDKYDAVRDEISFVFEATDGEVYAIRIPATLAPFLMMRAMTLASERNVAIEKPQPMYPMPVTGVTPLQDHSGKPVLGLHFAGNVLLTVALQPEKLQLMKLALADMEASLAPPPEANKRH